MGATQRSDEYTLRHSEKVRSEETSAVLHEWTFHGNFMKAAIMAIELCLPEAVLNNEELAQKWGGAWSANKIYQKTGIRERRIAAKGQCASDLGFGAAQRLFESGVCQRADIDYLLFCSQSPDYFLPTTACVLQERLGLPTSCGALDFNLGCSGYIYGLSVAQGLLETGQAKNVLLITAETYSKFIHPEDKSVRTLFGDAAAATLVTCRDETEPFIGPFVFGTDGRGAGNLIVPTGGTRRPTVADAQLMTDENGNRRTVNNLFMDGPEIFNFTLDVVPKTVTSLLAKAGKSLSDIDLFVFHQANGFILEHLRKKLTIPKEKFVVDLESYGNTVSATIPIALKDAWLEGRLMGGNLIMLVGFGVGYSWGGVLLKWLGS